MITQIKIQNFKNHNCSQLKALSRINLLLGKNNSGKTSALESLFLLLSPHYLKTVFVLKHEQRGYRSENGSEDVFNSLFYNWNYQQAIYLEAIAHLADEQKFKNTLQIAPILGERAIKSFSNMFEMAKLESKMQGLQFHFHQSDLLNDKTTELKTNVSNLTPNQHLPTTTDDFILPKIVFIPSQGIPEAQQDAQRFSRLEINNQHSEVINALKIIEPRLQRLTVVATPMGSMLYADIGTNKLIPLPLMGEGMLRTLSIALSMFNTQGGVILIDEFESGLHHSVFVKFWQMIAQTARKWEVQVLAATHSDEFIHAACEAMESLDSIEDLRAYRFDVLHNQTRVVDYTGEELLIAMDCEMEVR